MNITIQVDDAEVATEVAESLRHEAESMGVVHPGTADMLRGVAEQIDDQVLQMDDPMPIAELPLILWVRDYHEFETQKTIYRQTFNTQSIKFKELDTEEFESAPLYLAVFYTGKCPEVTPENIDTFRKVESP